MQVIRISPEDGILREIADQRKRIQSLGTRPTGNVVVRETLKTIDPETGVETIIGQLPDGSYGFQPFVGDTEPPPVATPALVTASPGFINVRWDGLFSFGQAEPRDFQHLNVVGYKVVEGNPVRQRVVGIIRTPKDALIVGTDVIRAGDTWAFTFVSEDYNGNESAESTISAPVTMEAILSTVDEAWTDLLDGIQEASDKAQAASDNASLAQAAADEAVEEALRAIGAVDGKGKVIFSSTPPGESDRNAQTLWIDTTDGANTPKRWTNGTTWVEVSDKKIVDAAAAAARAEDAANQAYNASVQASTDAGNALTAANGKNRNWYQTSAPAGVDHRDGDIWFDTDDGNRMYIWKSSNNTWADIRDAGVQTALTNSTTALTAANGKNKVVWSTENPTGTDYTKGDTWFKRNAATGVIVGQWEFDTTWVSRTIGNDILAANIDAGKLTAGYISADRIQSETITARMIDSGQINAGHIVSGSIDASHIKGKSITADKLVISSTDNLIMEADFSNGGSSWQLQPNVSIADGQGRGGSASLRFSGVSTPLTSMNLANKVPVGQDDRFRGSIYYKTNAAVAAGAISLHMRCYTSATAFTDLIVAQNVVETTFGTWKQISGIGPAMPSGTIAIEFYLRVQNSDAATVTDIDFVSATKAFTGALIVDGAIDGQTITGPTIRTATSGARIQLDSTGLKAYNASDEQYLTVGSGKLEMIGTLTARGSTDIGYEVRATMGPSNAFGGMAARSPGFGFHTPTIPPKPGDLPMAIWAEPAGMWSYDGHSLLIQSASMGMGTSPGGVVSPRIHLPAGGSPSTDIVEINSGGGLHVKRGSYAFGNVAARSLTELEYINGGLASPIMGFWWINHTGVPSGQAWGPSMPPLASEFNRNPNNSVATTIGSFTANDIFTISAPGLYAINWHLGITSSVTNRSAGYMEIGRGGTNVNYNLGARNIGPTNTATLAVPCIDAAAGDQLWFKYALDTGVNGNNVSHKIRIMRLT